MTKVLIALGLLLGLGAILGLLLALASKFFHVEEDPRIKAVEDMLPKYNCGACGKAGCHDFAESLVRGETTKVSACKAGKKDKNFEPIVEYLKTHPGKDGKTNVPTL